MAILRIPERDFSASEPLVVRDRLAKIGIEYEQWEPAYPLAEDTPAEEILNAYGREIDRLKAQGGYVTADVIDVRPETQGLPEMLARFSSEHWHDEDEVRFILAGRGVFHIHPPTVPVMSIEVGPGDLIRVPRGTLHWFDLCPERRIRAIRLFQDASGWTPHYTKTGVDQSYQPLCMGPAYLTAQ